MSTLGGHASFHALAPSKLDSTHARPLLFRASLRCEQFPSIPCPQAFGISWGDWVRAPGNTLKMAFILCAFSGLWLVASVVKGVQSPSSWELMMVFASSFVPWAWPLSLCPLVPATTVTLRRASAWGLCRHFALSQAGTWLTASACAALGNFGE